MSSLTIDITIDPPDLVEKLVGKHRNPRDFFEVVGVLGMSMMQRRLAASQSTREDAFRTNQLAASLSVGGLDAHFDVQRDSVTVGSNVAYAAIQNEGGTIYPTPPNKALAIPLPRRLKSQAASGAGWPRDLDPERDDLSFVPINRGNVIGLLTDPENAFGFGADEALYLLVRSTTIKAKHFADWDQQAKEEIEGLYEDFLEEAT